mmetsp:Transcript_97661/g.134359  ORF Transcript_97661/g.134359 Transcript_97661/m.134359 type:complete len:81 (+) Transcript_97661:496-738(+)
MGLDINATDRKKSTPLHWAAFSGAELSVAYITAWGAELNKKDLKGLTPLHLAVKSCDEFASLRSVKLLLIKGAERSIEDS